MTLKEATKEKHQQAEIHEVNRILLSGDITIHRYREYLKYQLEVFSTIENNFFFALPHSDMRRRDRIESDLADLGEHSMCSDLESVREYCDYLKNLETFQIDAHIYLNYMALLYGGQMIKSKVPGIGSTYDFDNKGEIIASIRNKQQDSWAYEVNIGFDYTIRIMDELITKKYHSGFIE